jgi:hypothetical protein
VSSQPTVRMKHHPRTWATALLAALALAAGVLVGGSHPSKAAGSLPCDIYASGGTPCVAAHSTTRALYASYNGPLYQVRRSSDNATRDIGLLAAGGYADAAAQDSFCSGTSCVITVVYDQSGRGNNLTQAPAGGAAGGPDNLADATAAPTTVGGHRAYGVYVAPGTGYRNNHTNGIATGDNPEGMYAVFDGTHYNGGCCFDYGNAETDSHDDGNGTMEAIYFGNIKVWGYGSGNGPWVMADLENGLFSGANVHLNDNDPSVSDRFLTAIVKGEPNHWAIRAGDAQSGPLSTFYDGARPNATGYNPMKKQGAIILGIGGDNSKGAAGTFYEGVMTSGYPSDATEDAVQANVNSVAYDAIPVALSAGPQVSLQVAGSDSAPQYIKHSDSDDGVLIAPLTADSAKRDRLDATWVETPGLADPTCVSFESVNKPGSYLRHQSFKFHLMPNDGTALFSQDATFCQKPGNSGQGVSFQSVNFTTKYLRNYNGTLYLSSNGGTNAWDDATTWAADSSWTPATALAPALAAPVISSPTDGATLTGTKPAVAGTGTAGVTVTVEDETNDLLCAATVAADGTWSCTAQSALTAGKHTLTAVQSDADGGVSAASNAVNVTLSAGSAPGASEQIQTTVTQQGGLVISVADSAPVVLPTPTLNGDASMLTSSGDINPVTVTDTRSQSPGWNVVGQVTDFSNGAGGTISAGALGWAPKVIDSAGGEVVTPGATVEPGAGGGLGQAQQLASAGAGASRGTAHVGATLNLSAPTTTDLGTYSATLTLTAI